MRVVIDWNAISDCYGEASEVPALIARLSFATTDSSRPLWHDLWSRLCHQGTVYQASYAALPLLLDLARNHSCVDRVSPLLLMGAIVASEDLVGVEHRALDVIDRIVPSARHLIEQCINEISLDRTTFIYLLQAASAFDGDLFWGRNLDGIVAGELPGRCPDCGHELHLAIGRYGFFATDDEWVGPGNANSARTPIEPAERATLSGRAAWLHDTATQHDQSEVALWIRHLFGRAHCPSCGQSFEVSNAVRNA